MTARTVQQKSNSFTPHNQAQLKPVPNGMKMGWGKPFFEQTSDRWINHDSAKQDQNECSLFFDSSKLNPPSRREATSVAYVASLRSTPTGRYVRQRALIVEEPAKAKSCAAKTQGIDLKECTDTTGCSPVSRALLELQKIRSSVPIIGSDRMSPRIRRGCPLVASGMTFSSSPDATSSLADLSNLRQVTVVDRLLALTARV